ncbi:23S rRNA (pseudouridine(1915)-N(3))-methyltransferase RlmH [Porphyromonas levii]|uniref:23S rRNA (pseudouridine(1915)-N(3))-methyltransferase RlmH n=1 Tax=Porphyromonas levii TaxID=28114 RepID=UPI001B8ACCB2|nr:23S rRNA (pseudouridine(1915)-N(3))-methyltransferase RlmH [Porphyromonas levii]MBR8713871.1 Ribosomal RNA large subunit methyltransferase H [Porphyromonas levii]MBR8715870.1 Ribosomal RNA large subunit methyltransferase H [Porphyromonas levii]MBR8728423.1 Ribosomal RNA large subunit methyltransferase H [Porphyromonas levii]MBR8736748.1 Ribosomal RNA large subunit methyltransferase H [Porphyromonas levii]MBR8774324.1 Ribosomal RNA large subunit methyltransferase H [Porphyromonas levii]
MQGIKLLFVGRTDSPDIQRLIEDYQKRLGRFVPIEIEELPDLKNRRKLSETEQKEEEGKLILAAVGAQDEVILMDERGKQLTSIELSKLIEQKQMTVPRKLLFVIGGPYGFSPAVYAACPLKLSLSKLTFSHQMVRLFLIEQIYRAYTIIHNHPYHHE